jgi:hypothetical protein
MSRITGPGGPHDKGGVIIDTTDAILLDTVNVAIVGTTTTKNNEEIVIALELEGKINNQQERGEVLYLFDADGAAAIVAFLAMLCVLVIFLIR